MRCVCVCPYSSIFPPCRIPFRFRCHPISWLPSPTGFPPNAWRYLSDVSIASIYLGDPQVWAYLYMKVVGLWHLLQITWESAESYLLISIVKRAGATSYWKPSNAMYSGSFPLSEFVQCWGNSCPSTSRVQGKSIRVSIGKRDHLNDCGKKKGTKQAVSWDVAVRHSPTKNTFS